MGTQQFLLITVGVVIVALMIAVSIAMFNDQAAASNRDAISNDLINYAASAQEYVRRPTMHGGGGGSFIGFVLPGAGKNADGKFEISAITASGVDLEGVGIELGYDSVNPVKIVVQVTADSIKVLELN
jgi:hypothetical protein